MNFKHTAIFALLVSFFGIIGYGIADKALAYEVSVCGTGITLASQLMRDNTPHCSVTSIGFFSGHQSSRIVFQEQQ